MTFATFAARASAGTPPIAWVARRGSTTSPGRARRTAAKPVRAAERGYPVSSARRAVSVPGHIGRLPLWSHRRMRSRRQAHRPDHPNRCSRRSQSPIHCPRPGSGWNRNLRRGAPRIYHLPPGVRRNLRLPPGAVQSRLPPQAAGPGCRPPRQFNPPGRRSPDHQTSPWLRTCWHRYSHRLLRPLRPLRPVLNRHSHSRLPSRLRPRLRPTSGLSRRLRSCSSRRPHPRPSLSRRLPGPARCRHQTSMRPPSRRPSQPRQQHLQHRSPKPPGPCGFPPTATTTTG